MKLITFLIAVTLSSVCFANDDNCQESSSALFEGDAIFLMDFNAPPLEVFKVFSEESCVKKNHPEALKLTPQPGTESDNNSAPLRYIPASQHIL